MSNEQNYTPAEKVAMEVFGVLYACMTHPNTPLNTKHAIFTTMGQILNKKDGPFQTDEDMNELGAVFADALNKAVPQMKGEAMLNNLFSKPEALN